MNNYLPHCTAPTITKCLQLDAVPFTPDEITVALGLEGECPRVALRVFCDACGYPRSEALYTEDHPEVPHRAVEAQ